MDSFRSIVQCRLQIILFPTLWEQTCTSLVSACVCRLAHLSTCTLPPFQRHHHLWHHAPHHTLSNPSHWYQCSHHLLVYLHSTRRTGTDSKRWWSPPAVTADTRVCTSRCASSRYSHWPLRPSKSSTGEYIRSHDTFFPTPLFLPSLLSRALTCFLLWSHSLFLPVFPTDCMMSSVYVHVYFFVQSLFLLSSLASSWLSLFQSNHSCIKNNFSSEWYLNLPSHCYFLSLS